MCRPRNGQGNGFGYQDPTIPGPPETVDNRGNLCANVSQGTKPATNHSSTWTPDQVEKQGHLL